MLVADKRICWHVKALLLFCQVLQWVNDIGMPGVNEDPEIADCLSKAEIFKTHFETGFYAIAKVRG